MDRRHFVFGLAALPVVASLPSPVDEYELFLDRVGQRVRDIVRREGRAPREIWIDPPRGGSRTVHLRLEPGGSLLDRLHFEFDVKAVVN